MLMEIQEKSWKKYFIKSVVTLTLRIDTSDVGVNGCA